MKRSVLFIIAIAALLVGPPAHAAPVVTTVTTFVPDSGTGCAGTQLLPVLEMVGPPLAQPSCGPQPPVGPGSASYTRSADVSGNMSVKVAAAFGTPVLDEDATTEPVVSTILGLAGPARSVEIKASLDVDPLMTSSVDLLQIELGDFSFSEVQVKATSLNPTCSGGSYPTSSVANLRVVSVDGRVEPGGHFAYMTRVSCSNGSTFGGGIEVASFMVGQVISRSTATVTAAGSAHLRSVTFTVDYV